MNHRAGPAGDLSGLSPWVDELAQAFVSLSSDIALVLDANGVIRNVAQGGSDPMVPGASQWVGRPWGDTVTGDTRRKIELLLLEATRNGLARRREVNHPGGSGADIPVAYTAIRLGPDGPLLAVGRDLRAVAAIQQRFIDVQQELERGYWKTRQAEARERLLHQVATDAVLVLDAPSLAILGCNRVAAQALFAGEVVADRTRPVTALFDAHSRGPVEELMISARSSGRPVDIRARLAGTHSGIGLSATPFRSGDQQRLLVRLRLARETSPLENLSGRPDTGVLVTDPAGIVQSHDPALAEWLGGHREADLIGRNLADWFVGSEGPLAEMLARVRHDGLAEQGGLAVCLAGGTVHEASLGATSMPEGDQECIGWLLQLGPRKDAFPAPAGDALAAVLAQLDTQIAAAGLPQALRDATRLLERHFVQQALDRSAGDDEAAARALGLSRDNLLRRRRRLRARAPKP